MIDSSVSTNSEYLSNLDSSLLKINVNMNPVEVNGNDYCRTYRENNTYLAETITQGVNSLFEPKPFEFWMFGCYNSSNLQSTATATTIEPTKTYAKISLEYNTSPTLKLAEVYFLYDQNSDLTQLHNTYKETLSCLRQLKLGLAKRVDLEISKPSVFANDYPDFTAQGQPKWGEKLRIKCTDQ